MPIESTYLAVMLPALLMYMLVILRMVERRQVPFESRSSVWAILSIRDAALVTLALDISEVAQGLIPYVIHRERPLPLAIASLLFALHVSVFLVASSHQRNHDRSSLDSGGLTRGALNTYFALTLLMTNAVTIINVVQAMGRVQ